MNYRHAFHAGNFADVVKHVLLIALVEYLKRKDKPFRVIDTHAGRGSYDLTGAEAVRSGEASDGIGRLLRGEPPAHPLVRAYLDLVRADNAPESLARYPGSPLIVRRLLRPQDRLSAYELHPQDRRFLADLFAGDHQVKAIELDGWLALGAHLPPKERRGLVLVDPPFEESGEFERLAEGLARAHRRWPGGVYALWYPLKRLAERDRFHAMLRASGIRKILAAEFLREREVTGERLVGSGLVVVNPPFRFKEEAAAILKALEPLLGRDDQGSGQVLEIAGE